MQNLQNLPGGVLGVHLLDDPLQHPVLVKNKRPPKRAEDGLSVHLFSPQAPKACNIEVEGSDNKRNGSSYLARKPL